MRMNIEHHIKGRDVAFMRVRDSLADDVGEQILEHSKANDSVFGFGVSSLLTWYFFTLLNCHYHILKHRSGFI